MFNRLGKFAAETTLGDLVEFGEEAYFVAADRQLDVLGGLWATDGVSVRLAAEAHSGYRLLQSLIPFGDHLLVPEWNPDETDPNKKSRELAFDGSTFQPTTELVGLPTDTQILPVGVVDGHLFYLSDYALGDGVYRWLWQYDGKVATKPLSLDVFPDVPNGFDKASFVWQALHDAISLHGGFYFVGPNNELWKLSEFDDGNRSECDVDGDGMCTVGDIDLISSAIRAGHVFQHFDLNMDGTANASDPSFWVSSLMTTYFGDANLDGEFNSSDLVDVLASGMYEADVDSGWATGDWNGDLRTNSSDLVVALADGGYEAGPRAGVTAVPEPSSIFLLVLSLCGLFWIRTVR
jgi:hypothetical protein